MTPDQQHHIRNGIVVIYHASRWLARNGALTQEQLTLVGKIQRECRRMGKSIAMTGASNIPEERMEIMSSRSGLGTCLRNPAITFVLGCLLASAVFGLLGCAGLDNLNERPPGCEESIIYDAIPTPKVAGALILVATNELVVQKPAAKRFINGAIDRALSALDDDSLTYLELARLITDNVKWINDYFGNRLVAYGTILEAFDRPVPISPCDRDLIRFHLKKEKAMLAA